MERLYNDCFKLRHLAVTIIPLHVVTANLKWWERFFVTTNIPGWKNNIAKMFNEKRNKSTFNVLLFLCQLRSYLKYERIFI